MDPTGVAVAAWVSAAAPSKAPFYVAGGLLAAWAVLLAAFGISHAGGPSSAAGARVVMATTVLLVAATISTAVITAGEDSTGEGGAAAQPAGSKAASSALQLTADPSGTPAYHKNQVTASPGTGDCPRLTPRPGAGQACTLRPRQNETAPHSRSSSAAALTPLADEIAMHAPG